MFLHIVREKQMPTKKYCTAYGQEDMDSAIEEYRRQDTKITTVSLHTRKLVHTHTNTRKYIHNLVISN